MQPQPESESELAAIAWEIARKGQLRNLTPAEKQLVGAIKPAAKHVQGIRKLVEQGADPLGDSFCVLRSPAVRRSDGAVYTPSPVVEAMVGWVSENHPDRVVDPGAGSGRFLIESGRKIPNAQLVAVETDPLASLVLRANLTAAGLDARADVLVGDYRTIELKRIDGRTVFVGNPPYVRHHQISIENKNWLAENARARGYKASKLAGLHVYFFLATVNHAQPGDLGCFITSAEWLDVNYGSLVRDLLVNELGGLSLQVISPTVEVFEGTATTAAITCFEIESAATSVRLRQVKNLDQLTPLTRGRPIRKERLASTSRWTELLTTAPQMPEGYVELGELCRVHRGTVTGANNIWVTAPGQVDLPDAYLFPSVTKAKELFSAGERLDNPYGLKTVIDIPADLDEIPDHQRRQIERFLIEAKERGAADGYIARTRRAWWSVGLRAPAPILATYMARRPPAFVLNAASVHHINIAHGLYPREQTFNIKTLVTNLRTALTQNAGRTYAGGLTKFEPKEMERLAVLDPRKAAA